jgi:hypothetical protein
MICPFEMVHFHGDVSLLEGIAKPNIYSWKTWGKAMGEIIKPK